MPYATFNQLTGQLVQHFQNGQYAEALELIMAEGDNFPQDRMWADYWKMVSAARVRDRELVYKVARKSLADGLWYGEVLWRQSPSYAPLQGDPEFEKIVADSLEAQLRDMPATRPIVITKVPSNHSDNSPLLIALHGNQSTAERTLPFWESAVADGWVVAIPESDQVMFKDAFAWDDLERSKAYVKSQYERLTKNTTFDPRQVVIAGHSMGGLIAIQVALEGVIPVRGLVVNGPAVPYLDAPEELDKMLDSARDLRAYFILGEQDDAINMPEVKNLAEKMKATGIPCEVEMVPNATHDYTSAYDAVLRSGLAFVNSSIPNS
ncbi:MAG TPA: alpha/beta fold hydrolase [Anaerolineales bacterium]|nr:alpha/beta fold hydrolase [Anaerolineales bacterium]